MYEFQIFEHSKKLFQFFKRVFRISRGINIDSQVDFPVYFLFLIHNAVMAYSTFHYFYLFKPDFILGMVDHGSPEKVENGLVGMCSR